jgi:hypothetical protein
MTAIKASTTDLELGEFEYAKPLKDLKNDMWSQF